MKHLFTIIFIGLVSIGYTQLTDERDGKTYKTVKIGEQEWMAENLAFKPSSGNYWAYDDDISNVEIYGYLYDWETAQNVCPVGWHLPSDDEWTILTNFLGGNKVAIVKMKSNSGWKHGVSGTNESGFNGLAAGAVIKKGYLTVGYGTLWWSSSEKNKGLSWCRLISDNDKKIRGKSRKDDGYSVRCIKD